MSEANLDAKYIQMTQTPVESLICRLAVPTIISNLITTFYNMADTFFIGKISTSASGAVGIAFAVMAAIQQSDFSLARARGIIFHVFSAGRRQIRRNGWLQSDFILRLSAER